MGLRLISLLVFFAALGASASDEILFGVEFEFANAEVAATRGVANSVVKERQRAMYEVIRKICEERKDCEITKSPRKWMVSMDYVITYTDGWSWRLSTDSATLEIQTMPASVRQFREMADRIRTDIFEVAAKCDLRPDPVAGAGHIHIGVESAFENNPLYLRNFLVDQVNHSELAMGAFGKDLHNAPPVSELTPKQRKAFARVIREFDAGKLPTVVELSAAIEKEVYYATWSGWSPPEKYQAINLSRIDRYPLDLGRQTVELRAITAQADEKVYLRQIELFQRRIEYLKGLDGRVALDAFLVSPRSAFESAQKFYRYVTETGLDWKDYQEFISRKEPYLTKSLEQAPWTQVLTHSKATKEFAKTNFLAGTPNWCQRLLKTAGRLSPARLLYFGY